MDYDNLLTMATDLGSRLMESGAEIYRVEETVYRLLRAYGLDTAEVFAIPNCLIVSVTTPGGHPITRMRRIPSHGTDIDQLERCNALSRRLCRDTPPLAQAQALIDALPDQVRRFPPAMLAAGYAITAGFFTLFFGGSPWDGVCGALCGLAGGGVSLWGGRLLGGNPFVQTAFASAVLSVLAVLLVHWGLGGNPDAITIGSLMILVPGMALTTAMREIMAGDIISGVNRTAEALFTGAAIALGTTAGLAVSTLI